MSSSRNLIASAMPVSQGAEAKVYKGFLDGTPILLKYRFSKQYRHPSLDISLTKARISAEARAILRCLKAGVKVPSIHMVDAADGVIGLEWIDGHPVRRLLPGGAEEEIETEEVEPDEPNPLREQYDISIGRLMDLIGSEIGKMHQADVIHGDLTTSNMMLRRQKPIELVLIDFGLAYQSTLVEDKAVDLYVLERAFASTHPDSEPLFASVLEAYGRTLGKEWMTIKRRLDEVRLRGRKRSMVG